MPLAAVTLALGIARAEIRIPRDFDSFQEAIDEASPCEPIIVSPGEYWITEAIEISGKDVVLVSEAGPEETIIRLAPGVRRGIWIDSPVSDEFTIEGFTFILGPEQRAISGEHADTRKLFRPVVRGNIFRGLFPNGEHYTWRSGGFHLRGGTVTENEFVGLHGAVSVSGNRKLDNIPEVYDNRIRRCLVGIHADDALVYRNTIEGARCGFGPSRNSRIHSNLISNSAVGFWSLRGCEVEDNTVFVRETGVVDCSSTRFVRNTIVSEGTGVTDPYELSFQSCTILFGERAVWFEDRFGEYVDSIIWPLDPRRVVTVLDRVPSWSPDRPPAQGGASHCVIYGEAIEGPGVIGSDPRFADPGRGDFRLLPASPCIDAGDPAAPPDPDGTRADIGALPWDHREPIFIRGDVDGDGRMTVGDPISLLLYLFAGHRPACPKAGDVDDDGLLGLRDAIAAMRYLFGPGEPPEPPFPAAGPDVEPDELPCGPP